MNRDRIRNLAFGLFLLVCIAAVGWPLYPALGGGIEPFVLGLPLSLAWIVGWLLLSFLAILAYDLSRQD